MTPREALEEAFKKIGNSAKLARALGVTRQAVSAWKLRGKCPQERCHQIEKLTGVPVVMLRPDIFGKR